LLLPTRVILDIRISQAAETAIGADAELDHKTGDDTKEAGIVIKVVLTKL